MLDTIRNPNIDPQLLAYIKDFLANQLNAHKIQGRFISPVAPTNGQSLKWDSTLNMWKPSS